MLENPRCLTVILKQCPQKLDGSRLLRVPHGNKIVVPCPRTKTRNIFDLLLNKPNSDKCFPRLCYKDSKASKCSDKAYIELNSPPIRILSNLKLHISPEDINKNYYF